MTSSRRQKEKFNEFSQDNCTVGTAARTRPFSFDEIMLRRKNKKQSGDVEVLGEAGKLLGENLIEKVSDLVESDRTRNKDSVPSDLKLASEDFVKVSSRKKEAVAAIEEDKLMKGNCKESRKSESKSKTTLKKNSTADKVKGSKIDEQVHGKRKSSKWSHNDSGKESERMHSRDLLVKDKHADRNRGNTEKESKRKHRNEDDDRNRDRNASKKHDSYKWRESEFLGKKEKKESLIIRDEDSRPKRRRSRSREHVKNSGRRSISLSPRAHKRISYDVREHAELSAQSSKDRSGRSNPDFDRMKMSSNGSSSHHRRHNSAASRLGGYSPRKRRTEAGAKTPSPTIRSPEKRSAGWDLPPVKAESNFNGSVLPNLQSSIQTMSSSKPEFSVMVPVTLSVGKAVVGVVSTAASPRVDTSVDSIQLTQATRPSRRLYIENLPASASKESVMEFLNNIILSSGVHHMQGTHPCISCSVSVKSVFLNTLINFVCICLQLMGPSKPYYTLTADTQGEKPSSCGISHT